MNLHPGLVIDPYQVVVALNQENRRLNFPDGGGIPFRSYGSDSDGCLSAPDCISGGLFNAEVEGERVEYHSVYGGNPPAALLHDLYQKLKVY